MLLVIVGSAELSAAPAGEAPPRCNLVIIVADALRWDVLGCYGGEASTPNLDWLAANGVLFENAHSTAPCTMPAAVSMFTGKYSRTYGIVQKDPSAHPTKLRHFFHASDSELMLAEVLRRDGYDMLMDVENRLAWLSNNLQGFDPIRGFEELLPDEVALVERQLGLKGIVKYKRTRKPTPYARLYSLLHYLLQVPAEQRFFVLKWIFDPHDPYSPLARFRDQIAMDEFRLARDPGYYSQQGPHAMGELSADESRYLEALYRAEVESVDERVGFILAALRRNDLLANTCVIFTSDHGEMFGEHGISGHGGAFFDPLVRVPLIFYGPDLPRGRRVPTVVSHIDLMPTLKDLTGVEYEDDMQGESYRALLYGESQADRVQYFDWVTNDLTRKKVIVDALREGCYKLVAGQRGGEDVFTLYDLCCDPEELRDVSAEHPDIVKRMYGTIRSLREENAVRYRDNLDRIGQDVDLEGISEETQRELRSLGYIK